MQYLIVKVIKKYHCTAALNDLNKDNILTDLQILDDEPVLANLLFNFETFGDQVTKLLLDDNIPTPFAIGLDGEWGSGKSTLLRYIENTMTEKIKPHEEKKNWKIIYSKTFGSLDKLGEHQKQQHDM